VAEPLPLSLVALFDDRRVLLANFRVEQHAGADAVFVENFHDAKHAHPRAVIAQRVSRHVGRVIAARAADRHVKMKVFDVGRDPERDAPVLGPFDPGPANDRRIIVTSIVHELPPEEISSARARHSNYVSRQTGVNRRGRSLHAGQFSA